MSDPNATGNAEGGGIIGPQDRPQLDVGGDGAPPEGSSPESYREAVRELMSDLVAYFTRGEGMTTQDLPLGKIDKVKGIKDFEDKLANDNGKARADAAGQDWITPESVNSSQTQLIDHMVASLQEIRNQG
ncbi:MAG TPA: hypothetical protein VF263_10610 [Longimicrobiaceae bacterium]